jgi:hypothetical protein
MKSMGPAVRVIVVRALALTSGAILDASSKT